MPRPARWAPAGRPNGTPGEGGWARIARIGFGGSLVMTETQGVPARRNSPDLSVGWRSVMGVAALAGLASGGIAVFKTVNGAGSAALLAAGLYFAIVTASGRFPRVRVGGEEIEPSVVAAAAQEGAGRVAAAAAAAALAKKPPEEVAMAAREAAEGLKHSWWIQATAPTATRQPWRASPGTGDGAADDTQSGRS